MEANTFIAPGHLPVKWKYQGSPGHPPPGYQHRKEALWMTPEIRDELQTRNNLRDVLQKTGNPEDRQAYQAQCQKVQTMIDQSKSNFNLDTGKKQIVKTPTRGPAARDPGFGSPEYEYFGQSWAVPMTDHRAAHYQNAAGCYSQDTNRKSFSCGPCNRTFYNQQRLDEHLKDHVECPFPECKLSAHIKIIDQHINNQHMLINFASLQIDDETWIAERKKRFPTAQRAELRRAEQMEKLKRGEKLGQNSKPFKKNKDKHNKSNKRGMQREDKKGKHHNLNELETQKHDKTVDDNNMPILNVDGESKEEETKNKFRCKKQQRRERPTHPPKAFIEVDLFDSDDELKDGICAFKGTRHLYESTGEVSYFGSKNLNKGGVGDENEDMLKDAVNGISDDEEWHMTENNDGNVGSGTLVLGGALGSLMGAYSDSEDEVVDIPVPSHSGVRTETVVSKTEINDSLQNQDRGEKKNKDVKLDSTQNAKPEGKHKARRRSRHHRGAKGPAASKGPVVPKGPMMRKPFTKRRKTLLEKLLQPDIIHERNVILQCVRFIVQNNFFDDASSNNACLEEVKNTLSEEGERPQRKGEGERRDSNEENEKEDDGGKNRKGILSDGGKKREGIIGEGGNAIEKMLDAGTDIEETSNNGKKRKDLVDEEGRRKAETMEKEGINIDMIKSVINEGGDTGAGTENVSDVCVSDCIDSGKASGKRGVDRCKDLPEGDEGESGEGQILKRKKNDESAGDCKQEEGGNTNTTLLQNDTKMEVDLAHNS